MKVLSLLQPWATLVVLGAKKIETRSWKPSDDMATKLSTEGFLIHASKKMQQPQKELCKTDPFKKYFRRIDELPLGQLIGFIKLSHVSSTDFFKDCAATGIRGVKWEDELSFGDYSPDRYGWLLRDPVHFKHTHQISGSLGLWDFEERICLSCGCMDHDCRHCIGNTGQPCHWVNSHLCSACAL